MATALHSPEASSSGTTKKRVAVIGAGPAGLAALRELLALGHDAVAFERQPLIGGVFLSHYRELQLTSSSIITAFGTYSDGSERNPRMWTRLEYLNYLHGYARKFSLLSRIYFSSNVDTLRLDAEKGTWTLRASPHPAQPQAYAEELDRFRQPGEPALQLPAGGQAFEFDHVAICSGVHTSQVHPALPGIKAFRARSCIPRGSRTRTCSGDGVSSSLALEKAVRTSPCSQPGSPRPAPSRPAAGRATSSSGISQTSPRTSIPAAATTPFRAGSCPIPRSG